MAAPKRSNKKTEPEVDIDAILDAETTEDVDKDALIAELKAQLLSKEEQEKKIIDLQKQLDKASKAKADINPKEFRTRPKPGEGFLYFEITWHPKRSDSDEEFVTLGVNGKMLIWPRNVPTVIRSDYLEVADNAFVPKFKQLPGEERKEIGGLKPYTYTINRQIDEAEYTRRKKEGDKALRADLEARGISK